MREDSFRLLHVPVLRSLSFLGGFPWYGYLKICSFIHQLMDIVFIPILAVMNSASTDIGMQISDIHVLSYGECIINFIRNYLFTKVAYYLATISRVYQSSSCFWCWHLLFFNGINFSPGSECVVIYYCGFLFAFPSADDVEHLFMSLCVLCLLGRKL